MRQASTADGKVELGTFLPLPFLGLVKWKGGSQKLSPGNDGGGRGRNFGILFKGYTHMTTIASFATIAFVLADAAICTDAGVLAPATWTLAVAAFLAFTASLTAWLGGEIFLVYAILTLKIDGRSGRSLP